MPRVLTGLAPLAMLAMLGVAGPARAADPPLGQPLLQATPLVLKDGRIAEVSVYAIPFPTGGDAPAVPVQTALDGLIDGLADDCFLTAQAIGHVESQDAAGSDTLAGHRLARARADHIQSALVARGLPASAIASVWDWQFVVQEPRVTLWVFRLDKGEDCEGAPIQRPGMVTARAAPAAADGPAPPPAPVAPAATEGTAAQPTAVAAAAQPAEATASTSALAAASAVPAFPAPPTPPPAQAAAEPPPPLAAAAATATAEGEAAKAEVDAGKAAPVPLVAPEPPAVREISTTTAADVPPTVDAASAAPAAPTPVAAPAEPVAAADPKAELEPLVASAAEEEPVVRAETPAVPAPASTPPAVAAASPPVRVTPPSGSRAPATVTATAETPAAKAPVVARKPAQALTITFATNSSFFPPEAVREMRQLLRRLERNGRYQIMLRGSVGSEPVSGVSPAQSDAYNQWITERRIGRVAEYLEKNAPTGDLVFERALSKDDPSRQVVIEVQPRS